eukprot:CAMPEP_0176174732 /NCGR_PEP_ID=MMETSP0120_2-20121206/89519_1 /TAXON_ID=160619 /ORGANISM="Kryptoperidinium foliaceum, Strain CCMP 1326" /LENGTH=249 /DNA_ID=CAMNT_0017512771 /DNA_START=104 /DNA_END=850 /DNA_ORIENTATION=+
MGTHTTLTISDCSSHRWGIGTGTSVRAGLWQYTFINQGTGIYELTVTDGTNSFKVTPQSHQLTVASGLTLEGGALNAGSATGAVTFGTGGVTIKGGGFTLEAGDFDASSSTTGLFKTSGGDHTINGNVLLANSKTLTVGSAGNGGATTLYGALAVGAGGNEAATTLTGGLTVTNGITLSGGDFDASASAGLFKSTTGAHTLNGDVTIGTAVSAVKTLTVTGATTSTGDFTVGSASAASVSTLWGAVTAK